MTSPQSTWTHDPDARLDYAWDWSTWLASGETIATKAVTASTGVTVDGVPTEAAGKVSVWVKPPTISGSLTCHITTSAGRADDRTVHLRVFER